MKDAILCAIDVNDPEVDRHVLVEAHRLAVLHDAQLDVVTVLPDFGSSLVGSFFATDFHDQAMEAAKEALHRMVTETLGPQVDDRVRHLVLTGKAYEEVLKAAERIGSDLIVIGGHQPDLQDYLLGPNASRIVRHAACSVYVVRPHVERAR
jgi:universal stress protein F